MEALETAIIIPHPSAPQFDARKQPVQIREDLCVCGHLMERHFDAERHFVSCEALHVEAIARSLAICDSTDRLYDTDQALRLHYLRCAWVARRLSTMGDQKDRIHQLATLEGADGCSQAYYAEEDCSSPYLSTNAAERKLWTAVFFDGFKRCIEFLGKAHGESHEARVRGMWRNVTGDSR